MKFLLFGVLVTFSVSAFATQKVGTVSCNSLGHQEYFSVEGDLYGQQTGDHDVKVEAATIEFSFTDKQKNKKILGKWENVPRVKGGWMSLTFANEDMRLDAWFDDVGAMSSIVYKGEEIQLGCDYWD